VEGVEVFYYSRPQSQIKIKRRETIRKEVINDFSDYLKPALSELINEKIKMDSKILAKTIARGLSMASREPIRKISSASFYVVSYPVIPAVLVEVGFIQSKKFLKSYYQKKIAKGILVGILAFIKKENKF
jgi:N-acetylmuramoyl-L-alanine amidase